MYNETVKRGKSRKKQRERNRTGKLSCPICGQQRILVQHHINGRDVPNANGIWNLVDICDSCHREVHEGIIVIEGWFSTTAGMELIWHYKNEDGITGKEATPYTIPKS